VAAEWGDSENNRRAKYYKLTASGRRRLKVETNNWSRVSDAMARALGLA
jgi:DNA-binding PadR family transcriptional regulator